MRLSEIRQVRTGLDGEPISEEDWFKEHYLIRGKWEDTPNGIVYGSLNLKNLRHYGELPVKFARIKGTFDVSGATLTSMKNFPTQVNEDFIVEDTTIKSFVGGPSWVGGTVFATDGKFESLEGMPTYIGLNCGLRYNYYLTSLKGTLDTVIGDFSVAGCENLSDLTGSPTSVGGWDSSGCHSLRSLKGISEEIHGDAYFADCINLESLEGLKYVGGELGIKRCLKLKKVLYVFKIKGVQKVVHDNNTLTKILNKYLPSRDIIGCQDELMDAGLEEYARTK
jgi:hypothetical protein